MKLFFRSCLILLVSMYSITNGSSRYLLQHQRIGAFCVVGGVLAGFSFFFGLLYVWARKDYDKKAKKFLWLCVLLFPLFMIGPITFYLFNVELEQKK